MIKELSVELAMSSIHSADSSIHSLLSNPEKIPVFILQLKQQE